MHQSVVLVHGWTSALEKILPGFQSIMDGQVPLRKPFQGFKASWMDKCP